MDNIAGILMVCTVAGLLALFFYVLVRDVRAKGWRQALAPLGSLAIKGVGLVLLIIAFVAVMGYLPVILAALLNVVGVVMIPFVWLTDYISGLSAVVVLLIIIAVLLFAILGKLDKGRSS